MQLAKARWGQAQKKKNGINSETEENIETTEKKNRADSRCFGREKRRS